MTIQELYDWAKKHDCLNVPIAKNCNLDIFAVHSAVRLKEELPCLYDEDTDMVLLD